jgi:hypothetical protein
MICLKRIGEEMVFMKTTLRAEGTSTPVESKSAVVATTAVFYHYPESIPTNAVPVRLPRSHGDSVILSEPEIRKRIIQ